jgi:hypothetical protein
VPDRTRQPAHDRPAEPVSVPVDVRAGVPAGVLGGAAGGSAPRRSRRGPLAGVLAGVLVLGLGTAGALLLGDRTPGTDAAGNGSGATTGATTSAASVTSTPASSAAGSNTAATGTPSSTASSSRTSRRTSSPTSSPASSTSSPTSESSTTTVRSPSSSPSRSTTADGSGAVPAGMRRYSDRSGFSVAVPESWRAERGSQGVYLRDPDSSAYLLVASTDQPKADPVADWRVQERSVSRRLANYRLIGIRPVSIRGWRGADWEFTHGRATHVLNRNLITGSDRAYALYWSAPDRDWDRSQAEFEQVTRSFEPSS